MTIPVWIELYNDGYMHVSQNQDSKVLFVSADGNTIYLPEYTANTLRKIIKKARTK